MDMLHGKGRKQSIYLGHICCPGARKLTAAMMIQGEHMESICLSAPATVTNTYIAHITTSKQRGPL